jgi:hypothetical protein
MGSSLRNALGVVAVLAALAAISPTIAAAQSDADEPGPFGPFAGYTLDPLAPSTPEDVPPVQQPDWSQQPAFNSYFGSGMLNPGVSRYVSVASGFDAGGSQRVYVASSTTNRIYAFDGHIPINPPSPPQPLFTFGTQAGPGTLQGVVGIAYHGGEVYAVDRYRPNPGQDRVVVYGSDGSYRRSFPLINPGGVLDMTGVDVMANEAWVTGELCGGLGGAVEIFDATTGALKGIVPNFAHAPTGSLTKPCDESSDASSWWDMAVVPELNAGIAQYRMIDRGLLAQLSVLDAELECLQCFRHLWQDGTNAVPGMRWFLAVDGDGATARGTGVTEYSIDPTDTTGQPFLEQRRRWAPRQAGSGGVRDIAYQKRDTRIDWDGNLTQPDWQHNDASGHQCLQYVVSEADIYAAGDKGEHWWDLANVDKIDFYVDGTLHDTILKSAIGTYCLDELPIPSGVHDLMAKAYVDGGAKIVTADNPELHIDHTLPTGSVDAPPRYITGTVTVTGSMGDAHAGPRDWQLQSAPSGGGWQDRCGRQSQTDLTDGKFHCSWDTTTSADGAYGLHGVMRDLVEDPFGGPNVGTTPAVTTNVDNTPPSIAASGELRDGIDFRPLLDGDRPGLDVTASDSGSGATSVDMQVDGVSQGAATQTCGQGGCTLTHHWDFVPENNTDGQHTITVIATDGVGKQRQTSWTVDVERIPGGPAPDTSDPSTESDSSSTGATTTSASVTDPTTSALALLPCTASDQPANFPTYSLGSSFETLPLTEVNRVCELPSPTELPRNNFVEYIYGDCTPADPAEASCQPPLAIQSWPACERNLSSYAQGPEEFQIPYTPTQLRGVPGAIFENGLRDEVYAGDTTVVVYGSDPDETTRAVNALQQDPPGAPPGALAALSGLNPGGSLPQPVQGALSGQLPCR